MRLTELGAPTLLLILEGPSASGKTRLACRLKALLPGLDRLVTPPVHAFQPSGWDTSSPRHSTVEAYLRGPYSGRAEWVNRRFAGEPLVVLERHWISCLVFQYARYGRGPALAARDLESLVAGCAPAAGSSACFVLNPEPAVRVPRLRARGDLPAFGAPASVGACDVCLAAFRQREHMLYLAVQRLLDGPAYGVDVAASLRGPLARCATEAGPLRRLPPVDAVLPLFNEASEAWEPMEPCPHVAVARQARV